MNEEQIKTRKQWLRVLIALMILHIAYSFSYTQLVPSFALQPAWLRVYFVVCLVVLPLGFNYITYHCAYKKPGTKLLTFFLICTPIFYIATMVVYILGIAPMPNGFWNLTHALLSNGLAVWWYFLHWKMRAINKSLQSLPIAL